MVVSLSLDLLSQTLQKMPRDQNYMQIKKETPSLEYFFSRDLQVQFRPKTSSTISLFPLRWLSDAGASHSVKLVCIYQIYIVLQKSNFYTSFEDCLALALKFSFDPISFLILSTILLYEAVQAFDGIQLFFQCSELTCNPTMLHIKGRKRGNKAWQI